MALAASILHFPELFSPAFLFNPTFPALRYAANQTRIRLERMAYLTLQMLAFDGGMPCDGGRGICRSFSTDTPRH